MNTHKTCLALRVFLALVFFMSVVQTAHAAGSSDARKALQCAVDEIMIILKDERLSLPENRNEKRSLILAVVRHRFDFEEMAKRTLAQQWKKIDEAEKKHFVEVFSQLLENYYIQKIEAYANEEVLFLSETVKSNKSLVPTIIKQNDLEIPIDYMLLKKTDQWRVYDVVIEGVSLVQNYRTQFRSIIRKEKYDGLVKRIDEKLAKIDVGVE